MPDLYTTPSTFKKATFLFAFCRVNVSRHIVEINSLELFCLLMKNITAAFCRSFAVMRILGMCVCVCVCVCVYSGLTSLSTILQSYHDGVWLQRILGRKNVKS